MAVWKSNIFHISGKKQIPSFCSDLPCRNQRFCQTSQAGVVFSHHIVNASVRKRDWRFRRCVSFMFVPSGLAEGHVMLDWRTCNLLTCTVGYIHGTYAMLVRPNIHCIMFMTKHIFLGGYKYGNIFMYHDFSLTLIELCFGSCIIFDPGSPGVYCWYL